MPSALAALLERGNLERLVVADEVAQRHRARQHLGRGHQARAVRARHQPLADDEPQAAGERHAAPAADPPGGKRSMSRSMVFAALGVFMVLMTRWPVSLAASAMRTVSVSRSSPTTMTSGSSRRLPLSALAKRPGVRAHLALAHQRLLARVHVLDRVLHGDDVVRRLAVDDVDERRERARLAVAGRAGDDDEALVVVRRLGDVRRAGRATRAWESRGR